MALSKRTQLYLSPEQWSLLQMKARKEKVSIAEIARRAIKEYCNPAKPDFSAVVREVGGSWRHLQIDPDHARALRYEWEKRPHGKVPY